MGSSRDVKDNPEENQYGFKSRNKLAYAVAEPHEGTIKAQMEGTLQLQRGIVIISVRHDGEGPCEVEFERTQEGLGAILEMLSPLTIKACPTFQGHGNELLSEVKSVREENPAGQFKPGNYTIGVETSGVLICQIIQPEIRQTPEIPPYFRSWAELGGLFYNTVRIGKAPLTFQGHTNGSLTANLFSFDGEEQKTMEITRPGPFHGQVRGNPGTEYLIQVDAQKSWHMQCNPDPPI